MLSPGPIILLAASLTSAASAGQTIGLLRSQPLPSPQELSNLESHVLQNPEDLVARIELLQIYLETAPVPPNDDPGRRAVGCNISFISSSIIRKTRPAHPSRRTFIVSRVLMPTRGIMQQCAINGSRRCRVIRETTR